MKLIYLLFNVLDIITFIMLAFAIFRIPFRHNIARTGLLVVLLSLPPFLKTLFFPFPGNGFFILAYTLVAIIGLITLFEIPFLYAVLIVCSTQLTVVTLEAVIILLSQEIGVYTASETRFSDPARFSLLLIKTNMILFLAALLQWKRIGFMFTTSNFEFAKRAIKKRDVYVAVVFIITIVLIQGIILAFKLAGTEASYFYYIFLILGGCTALGYYINYRLNIHEFDERNTRTKRRKKNTPY